MRVKFANALKAKLGVSIAYLGLNSVDVFTEDDAEKKAIRPLLVEFGKFARSIDKDVFVKDAWYTIVDLFNNGKNVAIVPDLRYANEFDLISRWANEQEWAVTHLRICRMGNEAANEEELHSICSLPQADATRIFADGDLEGIERWAKELCSKPSIPLGTLSRIELLKQRDKEYGTDYAEQFKDDAEQNARIWASGDDAHKAHIQPTKPGVDLDKLLERLEDLENEAATNGALRSLSNERGDKLDERILALERTDGVKARLDDLLKRVEHLEKAPWIDLQNAMLGIRVTLERMDARIKRLEVERHDF